MSNIVRTDRSRILTYLECPRRRWLEYHQNGGGIVSAKKPLALAVGGSVHEGLAELLRGKSENDAVIAALMDFAAFKDALDVDAERIDVSLEPVAESVGVAVPFGEVSYEPADAPELRESARSAKQAADDYLYREQAALVEALVRAWSRRRLRPLLEEFEVLEVEREGEWMLSRWLDGSPFGLKEGDERADYELRFMSRPDALLRSRTDNSLTLLSFKTASGIDRRRIADTQRDMQGLTEGVEVERRLAAWWQQIQDKRPFTYNGHGVLTEAEAAAQGLIPTVAMGKYLATLPAPPRILAIRYEFLVKGSRDPRSSKSKYLTDRLGAPAYAQNSHLVYGYLNAGMAAGDEQWNWSWDFLKPDGTGSMSKLNYRTWRSAPVWESMPIVKWIDWLDDAAEATSGDTSALLGYSSEAQATGYTATHPLDEVLPPATTVYRNDDDLRDCIEQVEAVERRNAESVAAVGAAADEGERRSLLNRLWPQNRGSCSWPSQCAFVGVCFGGDDIRRDPLASGLFKRRTPNHPMEESDV